MNVKVLSLKQPWAKLVVDGEKTIEVRSWNTKHRGLFYIHSSKIIDKKKCEELRLEPEELIKGAIIGKCELVEVKKYESEEEFLKDANKHHALGYKKPNYGFILENNKRIKPVKTKGSLGFWTVNL